MKIRVYASELQPGDGIEAINQIARRNCDHSKLIGQVVESTSPRTGFPKPISDVKVRGLQIPEMLYDEHVLLVNRPDAVQQWTSEQEFTDMRGRLEVETQMPDARVRVTVERLPDVRWEVVIPCTNEAFAKLVAARYGGSIIRER